MNIGDKVRVVHGNEEGFVTKIIDKQLVEIEIEPGFTMPVLRNELVLINKAEKEYFSDDSEQAIVKEYLKPTMANIGIYLAFAKSDSVLVDMYLVNNTDYDLLCTLTTNQNNEYKGIYKGIINSSQSDMVTKWNISDFETWPNLYFQALYFNKANHELLPPLTKKIKFKAKSFFKSKAIAPILNREAYTFAIDAAILVKDRFFAEEQTSIEPPSIEVPDDIIDLHLDKIVDQSHDYSPKEKFDLQFDFFQKALDAAIAIQKPEITFIHGLGNGTLKQAIHKELSTRKDIAYFQDAMKSKFGYGATLVGIIK